MQLKLQILLLISVTIIAPPAKAEKNNTTCGIKKGSPLHNAYGPWDYTNPAHSKQLPIVLGAHFNADVASLKRGITGIKPHGDIDYTLRAIPNYHPALFAITKLEVLDKGRLKKGELFVPKYYTTNCYFKRAIYFQPNDFITMMLYGMYFHKTKQLDQALAQYLNAFNLSPQHPEINYNLGLLYVDLSNIEKAKYHAEIAYKNDYPLRGLANKISTFKKNKI